MKFLSGIARKMDWKASLKKFPNTVANESFVDFKNWSELLLANLA